MHTTSRQRIRAIDNSRWARERHKAACATAEQAWNTYWRCESDDPERDWLRVEHTLAAEDVRRWHVLVDDLVRIGHS